MSEVKKQSDEELSRSLSPIMCITLAMGAIIGAGVFAFTGYGILYAGTGVVLAFICAGLLTVYMTLPSMQLGSAIPATGGTYMYVSRFVHPIFGYVQVLNTLIGVLNIAVMSMAFASYFTSLVPAADPVLTGVVIALLLAVSATFGVKISGIVQNVIIVIMCLALAVYIVPGFANVKPEFMNVSLAFKPLNGFAGLWAAVAVLRYTLQGGTIVMALGGEVKNPGKTIPLAFFSATAIVSIIYCLVGWVTVGVLPLDQVAGKPLSVAAESFLSNGAFQFFMVGGGLLATLTTLNGSFLIYSRIHFAAARDGIWPEIFKKTNKYKVPYMTLWTATIIGIIPIIFKIPLSDVFMLVAVPGMLLSVIYFIPPLLLPRRLPNCHKKAWFHMPQWLTTIVCVSSVIIMTSLGLSLFSRMKTNHWIGMIVFFAIGGVYWYIRIQYLKKQGKDLVKEMKGLHPYWLQLENGEV